MKQMACKSRISIISMLIFGFLFIIEAVCFHSGQEDWIFGSEVGPRQKSGFVKAVALAKPSVVSIQGEKQYEVKENGHGNVTRENVTHIGMGTGVIIDKRGYIITNFHVVKGLLKVQITTSDGTVYREVELIQNDLETDLALLKIAPVSPLKEMAFGSSENVFLAEDVIAIGNPYGYQASVSRGIVSGLNRPLKASDTLYYENVIQTDAAINPGNSGGPLINVEGEMIGLNAAVREGAENIAFAIPVNIVLDVADRMIRESVAKTDVYGMTLRRQSNETTLLSECIVESVTSQSPADIAGLKPGDLITSVNERIIRTPLDYTCAMIDVSPLDKISLVVGRDGQLWQTAMGFQQKGDKMNMMVASPVSHQTSRPITSRETLLYSDGTLNESVNNNDSNSKEDPVHLISTSKKSKRPVLPRKNTEQNSTNTTTNSSSKRTLDGASDKLATSGEPALSKELSVSKELSGEDYLWSELGIRIVPVTKDEFQKQYPELQVVSMGKYKIYPTGGVRLTEITDQSLLRTQKEKLEQDDLIFGVMIGDDEANRWGVSSVNDLCYIIKKWTELVSDPKNKTARIYLIRKNTPYFLDIQR